MTVAELVSLLRGFPGHFQVLLEDATEPGAPELRALVDGALRHPESLEDEAEWKRPIEPVAVLMRRPR